MSNKDLLKQMTEAGMHFGQSRSKRHSSCKEYIFGTENKLDIINLEKTEEMLDKAINFVKELAKENKTILFVGTKPESKKIITDIAEAKKMPYVINRWIGGTITNFKEIRKRVDLLVDLMDKKEKGELEKYTKKEQSDISKKIRRMTEYFGGLIPMDKKPDALFIVDSKKEHIALEEASQSGIPVITISNTDCDIKTPDYPILANDASVSSIEFIVNKVREAYESK